MRIIRYLLIGLHAIIGIGAIVAGQAFVRDPSGGALGMSVDWLEGSPFPDFRIPGAFLAVVIGGTNFISTVMLRRYSWGSVTVSLGTGILLVAWVAIQTAIIGARHWSQAIWWVTFPVMALLALVLLQPLNQPRHDGYSPNGA